MKKSALIGLSILSVFLLCSLSYNPIIADNNNDADLCINGFEFLNRGIDDYSGAYINSRGNIKNIGTSDYTGSIGIESDTKFFSISFATKFSYVRFEEDFVLEVGDDINFKLNGIQLGIIGWSFFPFIFNITVKILPYGDEINKENNKVTILCFITPLMDWIIKED